MSLFRFMDIKKYSHKKRVHFFINIIVGLLIVLGTHFIQNTELGESAMNWALDFFIKHEARKATIKNNEERILYVDINEDTYERWGKPLLIPRDKLASIIECAHEGGAKVVIVDILLDYKDCCNPKGDEKLRKVLEYINRSKSHLKIIFPILVYQNGKTSNNIFADLIGENKGANFHYGLPYISETQKDSVTRYWVPYKVINDGTNRPFIIWGIPLLAIALTEEEGFKKLEGLQNDIFENRNFKRRLTFAQNRISIMSNIQDEYSYRIRFLQLPENLGLNRIEAQYIKETLTKKEMEHMRKVFDVKNKIIIIGNSTYEAGDIHLTPVGNMAGLFIIGNAINTLTKGLQMSRPPFWLNVIVEIIVIVIAAWFFLYFTSLLAQIFGTITLLLVLGPISWLFFIRKGIFLNFVLPIIGMVLHEIISDVEETVVLKGRRE